MKHIICAAITVVVLVLISFSGCSKEKYRVVEMENGWFVIQEHQRSGFLSSNWATKKSYTIGGIDEQVKISFWFRDKDEACNKLEELNHELDMKRKAKTIKKVVECKED